MENANQKNSKFCPIVSLGSHSGLSFCKKENCGFWNDTYAKCGIAAMADGFTPDVSTSTYDELLRDMDDGQEPKN